MEWLGHAVVSVAFSVAFSYAGYRKRSLDASGGLAAFVVGLLTCLAGYRFAAVLILFFISSSFLTKLSPHKKRKIEADFKEGGQRDWLQVVANALLGTLLCVVWLQVVGVGDRYFLDFGAQPVPSLILAAFLGHYACCNGDTWASELGVLAKGSPVLITTFKQVPKGTNGAMSPLGTAASLGGGLFLGLVFFISSAFFCVEPMSAPQWPVILVGGFAGFVGSLLDSLLGATLQYSGFCSRQQKVVAQPGPTVKHLTGADVLTNGQVNFVSALLTAPLTAAVAYAVMA